MEELIGYINNQELWSRKTFGEGRRTKGITNHIRKELLEIEAEPEDLVEWIDVVILALDGAWRTGASGGEIVQALILKQRQNFDRSWPAPTGEDNPVEHIR